MALFGQLAGDYSSLNARAAWSSNGLIKKDKTLREPVWMKTSTGMPATSLRP